VKPTVDDSQWPIIRMTFDGPCTDEDTRWFLDETERCQKRPGSYVLLIDARRAVRPPATQRQMMSEATRNQTAADQRRLIGRATIIDNALIRGALTALDWVVPPKHPMRVFATEAEALPWLNGLLAAHRATGSGAGP